MRALRNLSRAPAADKPGPAVGPAIIDWVNILDSFYGAMGQVAESSERDGYFHPSSGLHELTEGCPRATYFSLIMAPRSPTYYPAVMYRIFENGHNRHGGIQAAFHAMARSGFRGVASCQHEVPVTHPLYPIKGAVDLVVGLQDGKRCIIDIKTIKSEDFATLRGPEPKHILQVNTYMALTNDTAAFVLYENKNNQKLAGPSAAFQVSFSQRLWEGTLAFCRSYLVKVACGAVPAFEEQVCKRHIFGCPFRVSCQQHREGEVTTRELDRRPPEVKAKHRLPLLMERKP